MKDVILQARSVAYIAINDLITLKNHNVYTVNILGVRGVHKADMRGTIRNTVYPILFVLAPTEQGIIYKLGYQCLNRASMTILKRPWIFDNMCIDRHAGHIACLRTDYIEGL